MRTPRSAASRARTPSVRAVGPSTALTRGSPGRRGRAVTTIAPARTRGGIAPAASRRGRGGLAPPAAPDVLAVRKGFGLNRPEFGRLLGYSERTLAQWETEGGRPDAVARRRYLELGRLLEELSRIVRPKHVPEWMDTPNPSFQGLKPIEIVERGWIDRLWQMIHECKYGIAT